MSAMRARMRKEVAMLESDPPYGVSAWPAENRLDKLEARAPALSMHRSLASH
jgi:hypothetical protein